MDISQVATGEYWYGKQALDRKLIDKIQTSDDFIMGTVKTHEIFRFKYKQKKSLQEKLSESASLVMEKLAQRILSFVQSSRFAKG